MGVALPQSSAAWVVWVEDPGQEEQGEREECEEWGKRAAFSLEAQVEQKWVVQLVSQRTLRSWCWLEGGWL